MKTIQFLKPRSLKYQLLSRTLLITTILLVLIGLFQYALMKSFLYGNKAASIESLIDTIPDDVWNRLSVRGVQPEQNKLFELETPGSTIAFISSNGTFDNLFEDNRDNDGDQSKNDDLKDMNAPHLTPQVYQNAVTSQTDMTYQLLKGGTRGGLLVVLHRIGDPNHPIGIVQVTTPADPLNDILVKQLTIFGFLVVCALGAGLMTFLPILRRTLVPLLNMVQTVGKINAGNLDERFSTRHAQTEIELLASSFNSMLERLETSFEKERIAKERMRRFIADASHELRTPLTSIHGFIEVLLRGAKRDEAKLDKALRSMYGESIRVNKLVQDLIFLARLDQEPSFLFADTRLDLLILEMEPQLRQIAGDRQVTLRVQENITICCDTDRIKQVILNLFQNAINHTNAKTGEVAVSLNGNSEGARISVRDNGTGIPEEHKAQLFERFYRIDSARSRKDGGVGLGLSIAKSIVDHHSGTIDFESVLNQGTSFHVWLPRNQTLETERT
jgi:two-component system, OmpR family, sensor kinase